MSIPSNPLKPGTAVTGKISWFGGQNDPSAGPTTASGASVNVPGIALYNRATLGGYWLVRAPNGKQQVVKQTDLGPAPWTGRAIDFTSSALGHFGYNEGNFPTDATAKATYLGQTVPKNYQSLLGGAQPSAAPSPRPPGMSGQSGAQFATTTQLGFNQKGYQQAQKDFVLGSLVSKPSPYDIHVKGEAKFANPLLASGVLTTTAPNPKDFVTAQNVLQKISGANLMVHPGAVTGKATLDAASAGAGGDAQKLLGMLHQVQGASYSQANHDAIGESAQQVRAQGTDCSGLISWLMGPRGLGLWHSSLATPDIASAPGLQGGRGRVVTVWNNKQAGNAGHVFIQIGNQFFGSEGGIGIHQISAGQAQNYIQHGSDGGTYLPLHPRGA